MRIEDEGIILTCKRFKEKDLIATVLLKDNGKYKGFLRSKKKYDSGTKVACIWNARLEDQLGVFTLEELKSPPFSKDPLTPILIMAMAEMTDQTLPERDPVSLLYAKIDTLIKEPTLDNYADFERTLLKKAGFSQLNYPKTPNESLKATADAFLQSVMRTLPTHRLLLQRKL